MEEEAFLLVGVDLVEADGFEAAYGLKEAVIGADSVCRAEESAYGITNGTGACEERVGLVSNRKAESAT